VRRGSAWERLGIEQTDDVKAIRRAYARILKEIDVEADPRAFIALRETRDHALAIAQMPAGAEAMEESEDFAWEDEAAFGFDDFEAQRPAPVDRHALRAAPDDPEEKARRAQQTRFEELEELLFPADVAAPADPARVRALTGAILADPEMIGLEQAARVESWMAWAAHAAIPRSDPMLPLIVGHFGWEKKSEDWDQSQYVVAAVQRYRGQLLLDHVSQPRNPHRPAWLELTRMEDKLGWNRFLIGNKVARLLSWIRDQYPAAEDGLNPRRVAAWDVHLDNSIKRGLAAAIIFFSAAFLLVRLLSS
jgi:hypothetical protein